MNPDRFLRDLQSDPAYLDQIVHIRTEPRREARYADPARPLSDTAQAWLIQLGIEHLYSHQAQAVDVARRGDNCVVVTSTASGKSLCYTLPLVETLAAEPESTALLLFPTKALTQDQYRGFSETARGALIPPPSSGVYDGDSPATLRRSLRDSGRVIFSNPDMLHAALLPNHARWARFLANLRLVVVDEMHAYNGMFGSQAAQLFRRLHRVLAHYGARPRFVLCSASIANPGELAEKLIGRRVQIIDGDGSPRGRRTFVFWNPPVQRERTFRSRVSANDEAHRIMTGLVESRIPTITFSKAKVTAEMIHRYVCDSLRERAPELVNRVAPYRGGYLPRERREIERRLFSGELLGVSTTRALELGIDVGSLEACIIVGYPGTVASFFQQAGRTGRGSEDSLVVLIGLDTAVNQYVMHHPEYLFSRPLERSVIDPDNPFVLMDHAMCAAHELPVGAGEIAGLGREADVVMDVLEAHEKVRRVKGAWYYSASDVPHHEVSLRNNPERNVVIEDVADGRIMGQVSKFDSPPLLHPGAVYMHLGDTYLVRELDLERNIARVEKMSVDYYTQPEGGTDVHHVDAALRDKSFGSGRAYWGEVTAYFHTAAFEKISFYDLDAISEHGVDLPVFVLETTALWIVPPEELMREVRRAGMDPLQGLRGIGYATRMIFPLYLTCDTYDFSHTVGSANTPWNAVFIYERYPRGLGFTEHAYELLYRILPAVLEQVSACSCRNGCPCCTGKPLRGYATWNVERAEASVPSKRATLAVLEGLLAGAVELQQPDTQQVSDSPEARRARLEQSLSRRLERNREPEVLHKIEPVVEVGYPAREREEEYAGTDAERRRERRKRFDQVMGRKKAAGERQVKTADPAGADPAPHSTARGELAAKARRLKRARRRRGEGE